VLAHMLPPRPHTALLDRRVGGNRNLSKRVASFISQKAYSLSYHDACLVATHTYPECAGN
jgi:hypothetical protein